MVGLICLGVFDVGYCAEENVSELVPVVSFGECDMTDLTEQEVPRAESLEDTVARFLPYWHATIATAVQSGQRVLIAAQAARRT